ncbi:adenosylcobinamide-GDP ribazoletransferase [Ancylobacter sp. WKF20]|uniref:adenosylcobinamide-GDP ribazoletransferase n=1 Tax=Ancylobacter sp. WKF20 TaxID=3039801 RepID=UPI0024344462|nr:adenosylcobinamide-GDP ribazoletransferase [Ancylobacter sp. WKF20]WGD30555.1 adenosylcobinamide-GDP ribazoletransferase [Ancylobacter sp. WKF20]
MSRLKAASEATGEVLRALPAALRFLSRLPVPRLPFEPAQDGPPDLDRLAPAFPLAGALIGLTGALTALTFALIGLPSLVVATLTVMVLVIVAGGLHEDGLADVADGLGGMTVARRLEIMRDSRLGSFGVLALILAVTLRVVTLQALMDIDILATAAALLAAGAVGRLAPVLMLAALPPARPEGLGHGAGRPSAPARWKAGGLALVIAALTVIPGFGAGALAGGLVLGFLGFSALARLARAQFGGQTGDVAGAAALLVEIAFLLGLLIFARHP